MAGLGQHPIPEYHLFLALSLHPVDLCPLGSASLIVQDIRHGGGPTQGTPAPLLGEFPSKLASGPQLDRESTVPGPFSLALIHLKTQTQELLEEPPSDLQIWSHVPGT